MWAIRKGVTYSHVKTLPAMKQAKTSSLPIMPTVPTMKSCEICQYESILSVSSKTYSKSDRKNKEAFPVDILPLFGPMQQLLRDPTDYGAIHDTEDDGVTPSLTKPISHSLSSTTGLASTALARVLDQIKRQKQERIAETIVSARFSNNDLLQLSRDVLVGKLALNDAVAQNWIGGCNAGSNGQGEEKANVRNQTPD